MWIAITLVVVISVIALVSTLMVAGKSDEGYNKAAKKNISDLSLIYIFAILASIIALIVYIVWFT